MGRGKGRGRGEGGEKGACSAIAVMIHAGRCATSNGLLGLIDFPSHGPLEASSSSSRNRSDERGNLGRGQAKVQGRGGCLQSLVAIHVAMTFRPNRIAIGG